MEFPEFDENIAVSGYGSVHQLVLEHRFVKPLQEAGFKVRLLKQYIDEDLPLGRFIYIPSRLHIFLTKNFILEDYDKTSEFWNSFYQHLNKIFEMYSSMFTGKESASVRSATFSFYYTFNGYVLMFQLQTQTAKILMRRALSIFELLFQLEIGKADYLIEEIELTYHLKDKVIFFGYSGNKWQINDPIVTIADQINTDYLKTADKRANKPDVMLHEDFPDKRYTFSDNWVLEFDRLSTLMTRPNDIGLFSSTADRNLKQAIDFYNKTILPRFNYYHGNFPDLKIQAEYYDYFEMITTALIFAYTAVEALANLLIPNDIQIITDNNIIHTKADVDWYSLETKLKTISDVVLSTPPAESQPWWGKFKRLQKIRNQSIHTKPSDSQLRYSSLLEKKIFKVIGVHKEIITFYGTYLKKSNEKFLNDFPYGFGQDKIIPSIISDRTYKDFYNALHNPSNPL
ncbi:hypothetical protein [Pedobacter soli]|uniref:Apea-like HEPN domain-containing protein n=1 Tax=Pedobacter soli TaxID=390242 RepID=A0A1G6WLQ2_9SPHI|nr:hypothetical protein [Pedobacter soli]SDD66741.1 hypothetical protein SAMN04488024_10757 [Pedobacter soli]